MESYPAIKVLSLDGDGSADPVDVASSTLSLLNEAVMLGRLGRLHLHNFTLALAVYSYPASSRRTFDSSPLKTQGYERNIANTNFCLAKLISARLPLYNYTWEGSLRIPQSNGLAFHSGNAQVALPWDEAREMLRAFTPASALHSTRLL